LFAWYNVEALVAETLREYDSGEDMVNAFKLLILDVGLHIVDDIRLNL
jgi:hypothetical protein